MTKRYTPSSQTCREDVGFLLEGSDGAPMPQNDELTINGRGTGSFGSIVFTEEGTYTYTVTEINDRVDGMSYDRTVYTAEVEVYYTEDGELTADVTYTRGGRDYGYDDSGFVFTNAYREEDEEDDTGALRIKKTVSGDGVDPDAEFSFRIEVGDISGVYDGVRFKNGVAEISLKAGESLTINGLPSGEKYTVTELRADGYEVTSRNETGRVTNGGTTTVSFNNHKDAERTPDLDTTDHFAYIIGYPDGTIRPEGNITRAEVATIFFRLLKDEAREANWSQVNDFTDVPADKWYNNAISTLANMGVISGYPDGSFRPDAPITRAELTKIAVGFFAGGEEYYSYNGRFTDVDGSEWYVQSLMKAFDMGIINGYPDGSFGPGRYITRAETCTIINRTIDRHPHAEHLLPRSEMLMWIDNTDSGKWYYAQMQEATNSHDYDMISILGESFEDWTEKLTERDWAALEKSWSDANSAPGGEVIS